MINVARRVRAWIETLWMEYPYLNRLKVARRVRAWIETLKIAPMSMKLRVARRVRAWIETYNILDKLKKQEGRTPCACVD